MVCCVLIMHSKPVMTKYGLPGHESGVIAYSFTKTGIIVLFKKGDYYLYDNESPGEVHVKRMKALAKKGSGLSTYISQHVHNSYKEKWHH